MAESRNSLVDILKGISCIFVILLHAGLSSETTRLLGFPFWCTFAVPVFMFLSGYVNAISMKKKATSLKDYYKLRTIAAKLVRFLLPFLVAYLIEVAYYIVCHQTSVLGGSFASAFVLFLKGGVGPGSYYIPIMVQFVLLFPGIYFLLRKFEAKGLLICGLINLLYEMLQSLIHMNPETYRLIGFRYTFIIALGVYWALDYKLPDIRAMILLMALGLGFIVATAYIGFKPIYFTQWTSTSMPACFFAGPVLLLLMDKIKNAKCTFLENIGKASFNVFLTQMIWYAVGYWFVQSRISMVPVQVVISLLACIAGGLLFYKVDNMITPKLVKKIKG